MSFPFDMDNQSNPIAPDWVKRAVYRAAPSQFSVEMLAPMKQGSSYAFGLRICPIREDDRSQSSKDSKYSDYVIWRKWDDCLYFQDTLETEYSRMAREKRTRLAQGKGVKKNGIYIHDQAASFESLPPGPDPKSVAKSVHDYLPKLTKKGTLFRASQATVDQRQREIHALIDALFHPDAPALIVELREERNLADFFGYWRRDHDLALKHKDRADKLGARPRHSISSSVFSMYFHNSASGSSGHLPGPEPSELPPSPALPASLLKESPASQQPRPLSDVPVLSPQTLTPQASTHRPRKHRSNTDSVAQRRSRTRAHKEDRSPSPPSSRDSLIPSPLLLPSDIPIILAGSDADYTHDAYDRPLSALPEDAEPKTPLADIPFIIPDFHPAPVRRPRKSATIDTAALTYRNARIFGAPPRTPPSDREEEHEDETALYSDGSGGALVEVIPNPARLSWQSTSTSAPSVYLHDLDLAFSEPPTPALDTRPHRDSMASFMTDCSADAIVPLTRTQQVGLPSPPPTRAGTGEPGDAFEDLTQGIGIALEFGADQADFSVLVEDGTWSDGAEDEGPDNYFGSSFRSESPEPAPAPVPFKPFLERRVRTPLTYTYSHIPTSRPTSQASPPAPTPSSRPNSPPAVARPTSPLARSAPLMSPPTSSPSSRTTSPQRPPPSIPTPSSSQPKHRHTSSSSSPPRQRPTITTHPRGPRPSTSSGYPSPHTAVQSPLSLQSPQLLSPNALLTPRPLSPVPVEPISPTSPDGPSTLTIKATYTSATAPDAAPIVVVLRAQRSVRLPDLRARLATKLLDAGAPIPAPALLTLAYVLPEGLTQPDAADPSRAHSPSRTNSLVLGGGEAERTRLVTNQIEWDMVVGAATLAGKSKVMLRIVDAPAS